MKNIEIGKYYKGKNFGVIRKVVNIVNDYVYYNNGFGGGLIQLRTMQNWTECETTREAYEADLAEVAKYDSTQL